MADLTKAALRNRVLQHIGFLAAGQSPSAEDAALVEEAIDASWAELRKLGLAPFPTSAIPDWAQVGLRDHAAAVVKPSFRIPVDVEAEQRAAVTRLETQVARRKPPVRNKAKFF